MVGLSRAEKSEPWYAGNMSRAQAEDALTGQPNGTFLIRDSDTRPGQYDLAVSASMLPATPTFMQERLPIFMGGKVQEPLSAPEVKHIKVIISYGKKKAKALYSFAPNERRKWWSMQQLVDFFTTDSLERHFVGLSANLSIPYKLAAPRKVQLQRPGSSGLPPLSAPAYGTYGTPGDYNGELFLIAYLSAIAFAWWVLVLVGWDGGAWAAIARWVLAKVAELDKMYPPQQRTFIDEYLVELLVTTVVLAISFVLCFVKCRGDASERAMAEFQEEQALARYDTLTWDDMGSMLPSEQSDPTGDGAGNGAGNGAGGAGGAAAAVAYDRPQRVRERTRGRATGRRATAHGS